MVVPVYYENFDLDNIVSLVNVQVFKNLLEEACNKQSEIDFLVSGFSQGFDIGYRGNKNIRQRSQNLKIRVGNPTILWNKIMKEIKLKRYAGPFKKIPFEFFLQSPVELVPKDNGKDVRLIFHLSHPRSGSSLNSETPRELTSVQYCDFGDAILEFIRQGKSCNLAKSDMTSAFRNLGIRKDQWFLLVLMAVSPMDNQTYFFVDKCLPFGVAISCSHFQRFSDAVAHILKWKSGGYKSPNYLDDFLFIALLKSKCDELVRTSLRFVD